MDERKETFSKFVLLEVMKMEMILILESNPLLPQEYREDFQRELYSLKMKTLLLSVDVHKR